ncbi:hypothetical protein HYW75_01775, partial [Candidatus Pacearchaeota archaeon]|nr:hypothetical protein [Candidatus Pacearchaeota archaeon]
IHVYRRKIVPNWGMLDSIIYATSRLYILPVLTKDPHFKGLEGVELLE